MNFKPTRKSNLRLSDRVNEGPIALHFRWSVKQLTLNEPGYYYYYLKLVISVIIFIAADLQYVALIIVFIRRATLLLLMINI